MKIINIRRGDNGKIWGMDIFDFFIDFRKWYKVYIPEEDRNPVNTVDKNGWSDIWFTESEVFEMRGEDEDEYKDFKYKLANPLIANLNIDTLYYKLEKQVWFIIGMGSMYLIMKYII